MLAVGAGLLLYASLPPRGWWWTALIGFAVLTAVVNGRSPRGAARLGLLAGLGWFAPGLAWAWDFSRPGYVLLTLISSGFVAATAALTASRPGRWWALPMALVVLTLLRPRIPLGGFPLAGLELGQIDGPFARLAGYGGAPLLVGVAAAVPALGIRLLRRPHGGAALLLAALVVVPLLIPSSPGTRPAGELVSVAVVQGGGPRGLRASDEQSAATFDRHMMLSRGIAPGPAVVLWPEDVVDLGEPIARSPRARQVAAEASRLGGSLIVGITEPAAGNRFRNAAVLFDAAGEPTARYDKVHRVPFGEYIPGRALLRRVADLSDVPTDAVPGRGPGVLPTPTGRLGVLISYEGFFADRARSAVGAGAELLLIPTNASSYRTGTVPSTQVAAARLRAVETGRAVVQAAPTGYSATIGAGGRVRSVTTLGRPQLLYAAVEPRAGRTPYTRLGDLPMAVAALLIWLMGLQRRRQARLADHQEGPGRAVRGDRSRFSDLVLTRPAPIRDESLHARRPGDDASAAAHRRRLDLARLLVLLVVAVVIVGIAVFW